MMCHGCALRLAGGLSGRWWSLAALCRLTGDHRRTIRVCWGSPSCFLAVAWRSPGSPLAVPGGPNVAPKKAKYGPGFRCLD